MKAFVAAIFSPNKSEIIKNDCRSYALSAIKKIKSIKGWAPRRMSSPEIGSADMIDKGETMPIARAATILGGVTLPKKEWTLCLSTALSTKKAATVPNKNQGRMLLAYATKVVINKSISSDY